MVRSFVLAALCCLAFVATSQEVQWACEVQACSQSYSNSDTDYKPKAALGEPDAWKTRPRATSLCFLFGWDEQPDDEIEGPAEITVRFCKPQQANRAVVVENSNPGTISAIYLIDTDGNEHEVYTGTPGDISAPKRLLQVEFPFTAYDVAAMRVVGTPSEVEGWNGLDGFGIAESVDPIVLPIEVENLGPEVNGEYSDMSPRISPDGRTLFFVREAHPDNLGMSEKDDDQDIWVSEQNAEGEWQEAYNIGKPLNNTTYNWVVATMPDGRKVAVSGKYDALGNFDGSGVSLARQAGGKWQVPKALEIDLFYNSNDYADYYLSSDERVLIMAIERKDSRGDLDLYVSKRLSEGHYGAPIHLGNVVNTRKTESAPFLASDGVTLYFSSDGLKGGVGDTDIWMTKRLDDTWQNWSEPKNLGEPINTSDYDSDFSISAQGDYAYLVRYEDSYGYGDVFRMPLRKEVRPNPVVLIRGRVLNSKTKEPVGADIIYELLPEGTEVGQAESHPKSGEYRIILPYGKNYGFMARAEGFYPVTENMDLSNLTEYQEIERDLYLAPVEVGQKVRLNNIFFEFGEATLLPESYPELNRVADLLKQNKTIKIELSGHTDNVGSDADNQQLSQDRAASCVAYLKAQGVDEGRIVTKGYGESRPVASNDTDEGRALNRRVEFEVLEK